MGKSIFKSGGFTLAVLCSLLFALPSFAGEVLDIKKVRLWTAPDNTRLVFDVTGRIDHQLFKLHKPERLVLDLTGIRFQQSVLNNLPAGGVVKAIRSAKRGENDVRVVLDLGGSVKAKSFLLKPNKEYGHRLVVDLFPDSVKAVKASYQIKTTATSPLRDLVIAIDAGHGGEDPGARGKRGTREKDVVLSISRKFAELVKKEKGMRPVLIRDGDYYLGLRKRMSRARAKNADLFISIHADAFNKASASGSSVFVLSPHGASSEMARWLAKRENAADLVGGVSLDDKDGLLAEVLLDLAQTATLDYSRDAANRVLREMGRVGKVHKDSVQKAGFMVLKSPDIPSLLIETAFISNPDEEKRLRSSKHQQKIAEAIMKGVRAYFDANPQPGTVMASNKPLEYIIKAGDTLSHIALQYGISLGLLRDFNGLRNDRLLVGKKLSIPADS